MESMFLVHGAFSPRFQGDSTHRDMQTHVPAINIPSGWGKYLHLSMKHSTASVGSERLRQTPRRGIHSGETFKKPLPFHCSLRTHVLERFFCIKIFSSHINTDPELTLPCPWATIKFFQRERNNLGVWWAHSHPWIPSCEEEADKTGGIFVLLQLSPDTWHWSKAEPVPLFQTKLIPQRVRSGHRNDLSCSALRAKSHLYPLILNCNPLWEQLNCSPFKSLGVR